MLNLSDRDKLDKLLKKLFTDTYKNNYLIVKEIIYINPYLFKFITSTKYMTIKQYNELKELSGFLIK